MPQKWKLSFKASADLEAVSPRKIISCFHGFFLGGGEVEGGRGVGEIGKKSWICLCIAPPTTPTEKKTGADIKRTEFEFPWNNNNEAAKVLAANNMTSWRYLTTWHYDAVFMCRKGHYFTI